MNTSSGSTSDRAENLARRAADHPWLERAARLGYAASGLIHLLIAWIALQVAFGGGGGSADQSGALAALASNGLGKALLWLVLVGFVGLGVWQISEAAVGEQEATDRGKAASKAVLYLALAWSTLSFLRGAGQSSSNQSQGFTAKLLDAPFGRVVVVLVGLVVIGVAGYHVWKGWTEKFLEDLQGSPGTWPRRAGRVGYIAKGVALAVVGGLFVLAGVHGSSQKATGLDGALKTLRDAAFGTWLLAAVALGLAAYGLYSFSRAKYAKV